MVVQAKSLQSFDTGYSADCIEWCPFETCQDIFVCGTYQVIEPKTGESSKQSEPVDSDDDEDQEVDTAPKQTQRTGRVLVFETTEDQSGFNELQRIDTPAILDAKWSPYLDTSSRPTLAVVDAKGHLTTYALDTTSRRLELVQSIDIAEETTLVLSLDFSHRLHPQTPPHIITSLSNGSLSILQFGSSGEYKVESTWHAHDFEPWCATWDNWDLNTVWSGGDDLKLKRWDVRQPTMPTLVNKRFDAGVTTITSSPHVEHLLAVGSYDENVYIFDARKPLVPLRTIHCGGGIWRARFHPDVSRSDSLLVAGMHDGFKVVRLDPSLVSDISSAIPTDDETGCEIVARFDGHSSLAYGADWSRLPPTKEGSLAATCSFYDHTMHLWRA